MQIKRLLADYKCYKIKFKNKKEIQDQLKQMNKNIPMTSQFVDDEL